MTTHDIQRIPGTQDPEDENPWLLLDPSRTESPVKAAEPDETAGHILDLSTNEAGTAAANRATAAPTDEAQTPEGSTSRRTLLRVSLVVAGGGALAGLITWAGTRGSGNSTPQPAAAESTPSDTASAAAAPPATGETQSNLLPNVIAKPADPVGKINLEKIQTSPAVSAQLGNLKIAVPELLEPNPEVYKTTYTELLARMLVNIAALTSLDPRLVNGTPTSPDFLRIFKNFSSEDPNTVDPATESVMKWVLDRNAEFQAKYQGGPYANQNIIIDNDDGALTADYMGEVGLDHFGLRIGDGSVVLSRALSANCAFNADGTCGINLSTSVAPNARAKWQDPRAAVAAGAATMLHNLQILYEYTEADVPSHRKVRVTSITGGSLDYS